MRIRPPKDAVRIVALRRHELQADISDLPLKPSTEVPIVLDLVVAFSLFHRKLTRDRVVGRIRIRQDARIETLSKAFHGPVIGDPVTAANARRRYPFV